MASSSTDEDEDVGIGLALYLLLDEKRKFQAYTQTDGQSESTRSRGLRIRLFEPSPKQSKSKSSKTNSQRSKEYRERLREDPVKLADYKLKYHERNIRNRQKTVTDEEVQRRREFNRLRVQRFRDDQKKNALSAKEQGPKENDVTGPVVTHLKQQEEATVIARLAQWQKHKQAERERWSSQKKRRNGERSLAWHHAKKTRVTSSLSGWLKRFKQRKCITLKNARKSVHAVAVEEDTPHTCEWSSTVLRDNMGEYKPEDIYMADETGLFYCCLPDNETHSLKEEVCPEGEMANDRLTVLMAANMTGTDKLPILVTGKCRSPNFVRSQPVDYKCDSNSKMTSAIFEEWVRKLDHRIQLQGGGRKIVLFICDSPAHCEVPDLKAVKLMFLPAKTICVLQACDQGIRLSLKSHYRCRVLRRYLTHLASGRSGFSFNLSILDALFMLRAAWNDVTPECIAHGFRLARFGTEETSKREEMNVCTINRAHDFMSIYDQVVQPLHLNPPVTALDYLRMDERLSTSCHHLVPKVVGNGFNSDVLVGAELREEVMAEAEEVMAEADEVKIEADEVKIEADEVKIEADEVKVEAVEEVRAEEVMVEAEKVKVEAEEEVVTEEVMVGKGKVEEMPNLEETMEAIYTLRRYLQAVEGTDTHFDALASLETAIEMTAIKKN